jgi:hypothetical protein
LVAPLWAADAEPFATPYRPTVSNPADLSAPGYFELEAGGQYQRGNTVTRRTSLPWLLKYAFTDRVGVMVGGEAWVSETDPAGSTARGLGDASVTLKLRQPLSDKSALGLEAGAKLATASAPLGSEKTDYTLNGIYSIDIGRHHLDVNLGWTRQGEIVSGESRNQFGWAAAVSHPFNDIWGGALEVAGTTRQGVEDTAQLLGALSYNWSKRIVLDCGAGFGLNKATPDVTVFAGAVVLLK